MCGKFPNIDQTICHFINVNKIRNGTISALCSQGKEIDNVILTNIRLNNAECGTYECSPNLAVHSQQTSRDHSNKEVQVWHLPASPSLSCAAFGAAEFQTSVSQPVNYGNAFIHSPVTLDSNSAVKTLLTAMLRNTQQTIVEQSNVE